jgi:hypothetical protein
MEQIGYWMGCGKRETERGFNGYWRHGRGDYGIRFSSCDEKFVENGDSVERSASDFSFPGRRFDETSCQFMLN